MSQIICIYWDCDKPGSCEIMTVEQVAVPTVGSSIHLRRTIYEGSNYKEEDFGDFEVVKVQWSINNIISRTSKDRIWACIDVRKTAESKQGKCRDCDEMPCVIINRHHYCETCGERRWAAVQRSEENG